jgi:predicted SnoaL-like aldol condensation-catalyzing enzyme
MGQKLNNFISFYIDGVVDGHLAPVLDKYMTDSLIQHTPGIADGRAGLVAVYEPLISQYDRRVIKPIRGFEDGSMVVLHSFQSYGYRNIERVVFDIIDTDDDDRVTEHWNISAPLSGVSRSGTSQIDGPTRVEDPAATETNKKLVTAYITEMLIAGCTGDYVSGACIDHDPSAGDCRSRFNPSGADLVRYAGIVHLIGSGNFVAALCNVFIDGRPGTSCDLYRLDGGRIVEHWNTMQATGVRPPRAAIPVAPAAPVIVQAAPAVVAEVAIHHDQSAGLVAGA